MSQDQRPGKVKLYSGGGAAAAQQRRRADLQAQAAASPNAAAAGAAAALPAAQAEAGPRLTWLVLLVFVLGCAIGGALFTYFVPF
jgi:hypothetical protein